MRARAAEPIARRCFASMEACTAPIRRTFSSAASSSIRPLDRSATLVLSARIVDQKQQQQQQRILSSPAATHSRKTKEKAASTA